MSCQFTGGQSDDYALAQSIVAEMSGSKAMRPLVLLKRASEPRALLEQVAQCQAIVAHRLHANIIAYSLGIPSRASSGIGRLRSLQNHKTQPS